MLRSRHHALSFMFPDAASLLPAPGSRLTADLHMVYGLSELRRSHELRAMLFKLGVPLLVSARKRVDKVSLAKDAS
jgi:hypothetical protein